MKKGWLLLLTLSAFSVQASLKVISTPGVKAEEVDSVKMYFTGAVNQHNITELTTALDEANMRFKNAQAIYLYINSRGGEMDSGHSGYLAIRSSRIPVTTVDLSVVGSAATMLFCGAQNRVMLKDTLIMIHAPKVGIGEKEAAPDMLDSHHQWMDNYVGMLKNIYRECTSLSDDELRQRLYSEDNHLFLNNQDAEKIKISTRTEDKIRAAEVVYFIDDDNSSAKNPS
ncbi:ATP-dependent Clp protease proteolytic subunit [Musicola paradisiaca]|uniref:Peptidase S14 ClpP n=1 Tax=Musicola paradisiaca (strain Ech703) TaxID=579405 RepID=C6CA01_MUSP7|nr:ATP-dependent Clp protease proteolytic subunit [Musicola paradisiaca]ACS86423.1 peptidase S14 ClpP [Musicola paradisiaca Ech703]